MRKFAHWKFSTLKREAKRLGVPFYNTMTRLELIDILTEAYV